MFELLYCSQPWLGEVPLVLLHDYCQPMSEAIEDIRKEPQDREHQGVLLRVMQFHGEMVRKRREADRAAKRRSPGTGRRVFLSKSVESDDAPLDLADVADELSRATGLDCSCSDSACFVGVFDFKSASDESIDIEFTCRSCGSKQRRTYALDEVKRVATAS